MKIVEYYRASSLEDAYLKLQEDPRNAIIAGGLWIKKMDQNYNTLIDVSTLGLDKISETSDIVKIGAMVTQRDFENSSIVKNLFNDSGWHYSQKDCCFPAKGNFMPGRESSFIYTNFIVSTDNNNKDELAFWGTIIRMQLWFYVNNICYFIFVQSA